MAINIPYHSIGRLGIPTENEGIWHIGKPKSSCQYELDTIILTAGPDSVEICLFVGPEHIMGILVNGESIFQQLEDSTFDSDGTEHLLSDLGVFTSDGLELVRTATDFKLIFRLICRKDVTKHSHKTMEVVVDLHRNKWGSLLST